MRNHVVCLRLTLCVFLISLTLCGTALAQDSGAMPAGQAPGAPMGAYPVNDFESINYFNGHLNFRLPLVSVGGRGGARFTVPFVTEQTWVMESYFDSATQSNVYYESDNWRKGLDPGFSPGVVQGYTARFYAPDVCTIQPNQGLLTHPETLSYLTFTAPDGTQYSLYSPHGHAHFDPCAQSGFSRGRVFTTANGSAATFIADADVIDYPFPNHATEFSVSGYLLLRDGTRYRVVDGQVTEVRDRNGNKFTVGYDVNGRAHTITDSLGRVVTINYNVQEGGQYGTNTQLIFSGFGGAQRIVRLSRTNLGSVLQDGYSLQPHGADTTLYDPTVTSSVWLPDGRRYRLLYNDMGELARMELPTGGAIEYDHEGGLQGGDTEGVFEGLPDSSSGHYVHIYRRLVERRVYLDGGTGSAWTARTTISKPEGATPAQTTGYVEVKQYGKLPGGSTTLMSCERHIFNGSAKPTIEQNPFGDPPSGAETDGREARTEVYDTSGGTVGPLLRKVEHTWLPGDSQVEGAHISEIKTTLSDTGQVTRQTFSYDRYGNQTDVWEYDFGTAQYAVRHTRTDYETAANYVDADLNPAVGASLRSLPRAQRVYSVDPSTGAETIVSKTEMRYDESAYSPLAYGVAVPGWSDPATAARGNTTSVRSFISASVSADPAQPCPASVCIETHARYDQLGNVRYSWDARGNKSEIVYGDSFCNGSACGTSPYTPDTFAFAISTKTPKPDLSGTYGSATELTTSAVYDFYTGLAYSTTDANNQTTYFEYEAQPNQLDRLKAVVRPDGGRTDFYYGDTAGNLYVRTRSDLDAARRTESRQYFDGLGMVYRKSTYENSVTAQPWLNVDTAYDAAGRVTMTSMAYRSSGGGTPLTAAEWSNAKRAETQYDSLGRVLKVKTMPDGAYVQTDYSGNRVLVKDQMGRERVSRTDALGRLTEVWEITPQESGAEASTVALTQFPGHAEASYGYLTSYKYDARGNLRMVEQPGQHLGQQVTQRRFFAYDSLGRLVRAKNPEQSNFTADPDGGDFPALTDSSSGVSNSQWSMGYLYDANGNLAKRRDARGVTVTYGYDNLNRNTTVRYTDSVLGAGNHTQDVDRYYDNSVNGANGLGRIWKTQTSQTALTMTDLYDEAGRPKKQTQQFWVGGLWGQPYIVQQSYSKAGGVTSQTYPSSNVVYYNYDAAGRLGDNGSGAAFYGNLGDGVQRTYASEVRYQEMGGMEQERFGTDTPVYNKRLYNSRGQMAEIRVSTYSLTAVGHETDWNRGAIINHYSLATGAWGATGGGADNNGNLRKQDIYISNTDDVNTGGSSHSTTFYDYDYLNRLYQARESYGESNPWVQYFDYDRWGNRTINAANTTGSAPEPQFSVDASTNRLGVPVNQSGVISYDSAGNITNDTYQGGGTRAYDAENRMTSAQFVSGQTQTALYTYDGDGRRVKRKAGAGDEVWQVYGMSGELLAEYAANASYTQPQKEYGYRGGELLVTADCAARVNHALASNGGVASAQNYTQDSVNPGLHFQPSYAIDGGRHIAAAGDQYWRDEHGLSSWLQVDFSGQQTIDEIDVLTVADYPTYYSDPTATHTFTQYGATAYDVQYWTGSAWATVSGGSVTGNSQVWKKFNFTAVTTTKIRVVVSGAVDGVVRIAEVEAWTAGGAGGGELRWLVADQLGTPRMVVDKSGSLSGVSRHDYLPFGEELSAGIGGRTNQQGYGVPDGARQKFGKGYERDDETGLDYAQARYYASAQGRFTSPDPLLSSGKPLQPQSWNRYAYTLNNPLKYIDPSGLIWGRKDGDANYKWFDNEEDMKKAGYAAATRFLYEINGTYYAVNPNANQWKSFNNAWDAERTFWGYTGLESSWQDWVPVWGQFRRMMFNIATENYDGAMGNFAMSSIDGGTLAAGAMGRSSTAAVSLMDDAARVVADEGVTTLYRAVSHAEFEQIVKDGVFKAGSNSLGGKWFAESAEHAAQWGQKLEGTNGFRIVDVRLPTVQANRLMRIEALDGIGPARYAELNQLQGAKIGVVK